jgi:galactokinase
VKTSFEDVFNHSAEGEWRAPGRLNLIGEFTDYNDGFVLPMALDATTSASVARRDDDLIRIYSANLESTGSSPIQAELADLQPTGTASWANYALGVAWSLQEDGHRLGGIDVLIDSEVPIGAGLSSSAALECAVGLALRDLFAPSLSRRELALICQRAENRFVGVPSGIMDQTASLCCTQGHAILFDTRSGDIEQLGFDLAASNLKILVIDTLVRHELASSAYADRRSACERAARDIGVAALRDATLADISRVKDPVDQKRARHVINEDVRVLVVADLLRAGAVDEVGAVLNAAHRSLRDDFEVSCAELDLAADTAVESGALGARMIGGGFGGCVIALVRPNGLDAVEQALRTAFAREGFHSPRCFTAVPAQGARRVR